MDFSARRHMDEELQGVRDTLFKMAVLTEKSVKDAVWALVNRDESVAQSVLNGDDAIDALAHDVDSSCFSLIARYQPVALDLRQIAAMVHMAIDLERIGDLAGNIAEIVMHRPILAKPLVDIPRMSELVIEMINLSMTAFLKEDVAPAHKAFAMDDLVDDLETQVFRELFVMIMENPEIMERANRLIMISRILERAGDHATNLSEQACFAITGEKVKASQFRRPREAL